MRPSGLFDAPGVTAYELHEDQAPGIFTSRAALAASMLDQATDTRFVRKAAAVTTSEGAPALFQMIRREALKKTLPRPAGRTKQARPTHRSHPGTRFATRRQLQPPVRSDTQITQLGVERTRCRRALQAAPNGGSASGYQAIFAPSAALGSPG